MQPWYWTGIAITLCQVLGLHRNPDGSRYNSSVTDRQRMLWRRLWWSCFFRDRWLGLTFGRPFRINIQDCDTPWPLVSDLMYDVEATPEVLYAAFVPSEMPRLARYWVTLVELSKLLGDCIVMNYQIQRPKPSVEDVEALEQRLLQCELPDQYEKGLTRLATFYCCHVHLHYQYIPFPLQLVRESVLTSTFQGTIDHLLPALLGRDTPHCPIQQPGGLVPPNATQNRRGRFADQCDSRDAGSK